MHNYASNNPTTALSLARGETPRLRHRDISFEALTVPEGNITFSPSRYSSHSQVPSTPVSQSRTLSMLLQGEKIQDAKTYTKQAGKLRYPKTTGTETISSINCTNPCTYIKNREDFTLRESTCINVLFLKVELKK